MKVFDAYAPEAKERTTDAHPHIPAGGTLGILAVGYRGIMIWRYERHRLRQAKLAKKV